MDHHRCKKLWTAVLERAIEDTKGNFIIRKPKPPRRITPKSKKRRERNLRNWEDQRKQIVADAKSWFFSNTKTIGSFLWICDVLDCEPFSLREGIAEKTKREQTYGRALTDRHAQGLFSK